MCLLDEVLYEESVLVTDPDVISSLFSKNTQPNDALGNANPIGSADYLPLESMFVDSGDLGDLSEPKPTECQTQELDNTKKGTLVDGRIIDLDSEKYLDSYRRYATDFEDPNIVFEPILSETSFRYTTYPIKYWTIWKNYTTQQKNNWVVGEVDLSKDVDHWEKMLSNNDRYFLMHVLAMFASADGIVNANIKQNLIDVVKIKEAECAYGKQFDMENVHGEMYSLMIDTFVKDPALRDKLINSIRTMPSMKAKAKWCQEWIDCDKSYAHKLVAFAVVEGVFFSGSFASIFWLKTRPGAIMPGLRKSNKFIAKDEAQHVELACLLYNLLKNRLKEEVVHKIFSDAVKIETYFITSSLPCKLIGMNVELMTQYIKYVADRVIVQLGYNKLYNVTNPFEFMNKIDTHDKGNFFEERIDAYQDSKIDNPRVFARLDYF